MHVRKAIHAYKAIAGRTARYQRSSPLACVCRGLHRSLAHHNQETTSRNTTHFGYQTVYEDEKETKVAEVFHNVANKYDLMNDAMSFGIHRLWKDTFVHQLNPRSGWNILDIGGGTGDISFRILKYLNINGSQEMKNHNSVDDNPSDNRPKNCTINVVDINQSMLDVGKIRGKKLGYEEDIKWIKGDAENLPVKDSSVDLVTAAFAIRNVTNIRKAISEAYRVLTPGGRFSVLEFSHVTNPYLRSLYDMYSFEMIPVMGEIIADDWQSYQYLVESIRKFPTQEEFADMFKQAGFRFVKWQNLTFGTVAIHSGFKI